MEQNEYHTYNNIWVYLPHEIHVHLVWWPNEETRQSDIYVTPDNIWLHMYMFQYYEMPTGMTYKRYE